MSLHRAGNLVRDPLYLQVAEMILTRYVQGRSIGIKLPPERELSELVKVSMGTIRAALSDLEKRGYVERSHGSGTFTAEPKRTDQRHVAVLLDVDITSGNLSPYYPLIAREVRKHLTNLGIPNRFYLGDLALGVEPTGITCQDFLEDVKLGRIKGMISFFTARERSWVQLLKSQNIPFIDPEWAWEYDNSRKFVHFSLDYLRKKGRSRVAAILWESPTDGNNVFSKTLRELAPQYGITLDPDLLDISANGWESGMGWERFRDIWSSTKQKPDGLIVGDDMLFSDCQRAIIECGVNVPRDLEIILRSSDAFELSAEFPLCVWREQAYSAAELYAKTMRLMLDGTNDLGAGTGMPYQIEFPDEIVGMEEASQYEGVASIPNN